MSQMQKIAQELLPIRQDYINLTELVDECEKRNIPVSRRTIHNYVKDCILPKPVHQGLEALFHKQFIIDEIAAIHILKTVFHVSYVDLKLISKDIQFNLQDVVPHLYGILNYLQDNHQGKLKRRPMLVNISNEKFLEKIIRLFMDEIIKKKNPHKIKMGDFINYAFKTIK